jgi:hypothetical protein
MNLYIYYQNNIRGGFNFDDNVGVGVIVGCLAENEEQADEILAEKCVLDDNYCNCCGYRWMGVSDEIENISFEEAKSIIESSESDGYPVFLHDKETLVKVK